MALMPTCTYNAHSVIATTIEQLIHLYLWDSVGARSELSKTNKRIKY